jgi:uncharacterized protein (TIGR03118 family)
MQPISRRFAMMMFALLVSVGTARAGDVYLQTNLVTNDQSVTQAQQTDPNLINPWGVSFSTGSPLWVSNQGAGTGPGANGTANSTVYGLTGNSSSPTLLTVQIPNLGMASPSDANGPTGQVSTGAPGITTVSTDFQVSGGKAAFIFANLDGSISAWRGGLTPPLVSQIITTATVPGASFTGLAIGNVAGGAAQIYAADQNSQNVYIFNSSWAKIGTFTDTKLPAGFNAFNVQNINGTLFVTYANPNNGAGGIVDEFKTDGTLIKRLIDDSVGDHLNTPWGLALAPSSFGKFSNDLLVGNNDVDGFINAYSVSGAWQGTLMLNNGKPFSEGELWALTFGNGASGGSKDVLYFDAGLDGATNGLLGSLSVPEPSSAVLGLIAVGLLAGCRLWKNRRRTVNS